MTTRIAPAPSTKSRRRIRTAQVLAWTLAVVAAVPFFGLVDLATLPGWVNQEYVWEVPLEVSWGALFTFFLAGGFVSIAIAPHRARPALVQLGVTAIALAVSAAAGLDGRPAAVAVVVAGATLLLGWLTTDVHAWRLRASLSRTHLLLALAGAALWLPYALSAFDRSRAGVLGSITNGIEHWPVQGATGLALALAAAVMAVWRPARALFRGTIALSAALIALACAAFPDREGATESLQWAIAVTVWAVLLTLPATAPTGDRADGADEATERS